MIIIERGRRFSMGVKRSYARRRGSFVAMAICLAVTVGACSAGDGDASGGDEVTTTTSTSAAEGPVDGPVADMSEPLTGGDGVFVGSPEGVHVDGPYHYEFERPGYVEEEFVAEGTATAYVAPDELSSDGRWTLTEGDTADYRTRVLVRRPKDPDQFSGVVVVEWFNVSGGIDADPEWTSVSEEVVRQGHVWVGVSAQTIGVAGGPVGVKVDVPGSEMAGTGLVGIDPERYGSLVHPGDAYSYDIYTQIARGLREGGGIDGLDPTMLLAVGESQSAGALVTYYNAFQPMTRAFDGFFVHSRGASGLPIPPPGEFVDITNTIGRAPTIFRTDVAAPIVDLQAEGDVGSFLSSLDARQDDSDTLRIWELAGSPHADEHLAGKSTLEISNCGAGINNGPMHIVAKAGLRALVEWVQTGTPPPTAPRLEVTEGDDPEVARDEDGLAIGGLRPPPIAVPVEVLSGAPGTGDAVICVMTGSSTPLPPERLSELYESPADYEEQYRAAVEDSIETGFVLEEDREAIEAYLDPEAIPA